MRPTARWRRSTPRIESRGPEFRLGKTYGACSSPDRAFGSGPKGSRSDSCQAHFKPYSSAPARPPAPANHAPGRLFRGLASLVSPDDSEPGSHRQSATRYCCRSVAPQSFVDAGEDLANPSDVGWRRRVGRTPPPGPYAGDLGPDSPTR